jgi:hypothetical protein
VGSLFFRTRKNCCDSAENVWEARNSLAESDRFAPNIIHRIHIGHNALAETRRGMPASTEAALRGSVSDLHHTQ